ncbi:MULTISPECIES: aldolase [Bacillus]|uniref:aldolase n=1 Tax=Bacillus TaxID=1386 RepID=UPI000EA027BA|nr:MULTISPECIES: aldolase [Bacillus]AYF07692.1 aldolase [Bacillus mobilis]BCD30676.1 HPr kinase [Bacillus cereus]HDX9572470.1 aldolase [Bacillus mobilis]
MIDSRRNVLYKAFGLKIVSEIPLPELSQLNEKEEMADVQIEITDLSERWDRYDESQQKTIVVEDDVVMFHVPQTAIFSIQAGEKITFSPMSEAKEDKIRLYILGTCMGALLMQRKILPLHGSVIAIDGKAYALIGDSGAGKSTLASAFLNKGYQLLSDDVVAVSLLNKNTAVVHPSYAQQKLWQESINELGMVVTQFSPLFERETKYAVPVNSQFFPDPLPLAGVIELVKTQGEDIEMIRIEGLTRLYKLYQHTFRNSLISKLGLMEWHFETSSNVASGMEMFQLRRPDSKFTAHELVQVILNTIQKGSMVDGCSFEKHIIRT